LAKKFYIFQLTRLFFFSSLVIEQADSHCIMNGQIDIAFVQIKRILGQHVHIVKEETIPFVRRLFDRLQVASVHEHASIECQIGHGLN